MPVTSSNGSSAARIHDDHRLRGLVGLLLVVDRNLHDASKPDRPAITSVGNEAELFVAVHAFPVCTVLVGRALQALVGTASVRVPAIVLHAVGLLPRDPLFWVSGRVHGVELVVQRPDSIPFELQVQVAVHILQEVLQPVGRRWLLRQPIDVTGIVLHHPPQLELLVLAEVQLFRTQVVDLVLDQPLLESDVVVVDRDELVGLVRVVVRGQASRHDGHELLQVVLMLVRLMLMILVVVMIVCVVVIVSAMFLRNDDLVVLLLDVLVLSCPSDFLLRVLIILIMFIFGRIVLRVIRDVLEVRLHAPGVIEVGLVVEDVGILLR